MHIYHPLLCENLLVLFFFGTGRNDIEAFVFCFVYKIESLFSATNKFKYFYCDEYKIESIPRRVLEMGHQFELING